MGPGRRACHRTTARLWLCFRIAVSRAGRTSVFTDRLGRTFVSKRTQALQLSRRPGEQERRFALKARPFTYPIGDGSSIHMHHIRCGRGRGRCKLLADLHRACCHVSCHMKMRKVESQLAQALGRCRGHGGAALGGANLCPQRVRGSSAVISGNQWQSARRRQPVPIACPYAAESTRRHARASRAGAARQRRDRGPRAA